MLQGFEVEGWPGVVVEGGHEHVDVDGNPLERVTGGESSWGRKLFDGYCGRAVATLP